MTTFKVPRLIRAIHKDLEDFIGTLRTMPLGLDMHVGEQDNLLRKYEPQELIDVTEEVAGELAS